MAGSKSAPVTYSKGRVRADTRKLDQEQKRLSENADAVAASLSVDAWSWTVEFPENRDYRFIINLPYGGTVNTQTTRCTAGTATVTGKINATAFGGTANAASTTEQAQAHSTNNTFVAGDDYVATISAVSGCANLTITVKVTRAI